MESGKTRLPRASKIVRFTIGKTYTGDLTLITVKEGKHRLFEDDPETARVVSEILHDIEKGGMDAVRKLSEKFDAWNPPSFELTPEQIAGATASLSQEAIDDIAYCQENVRRFAQAQRDTLLELETEIRPGIVLGHRHIPVSAVGSYIPGGRYPMFGSAQMSIIPAKVAGVETVVACTPPVKGEGFYPTTIHAMAAAGADRIFVLGGVQAMAMMAFGLEDVPAVDVLCGAGKQVRRRGETPVVRPLRDRPSGRSDRNPHHRRRHGRPGAGRLRSAGPGGTRSE